MKSSVTRTEMLMAISALCLAITANLLSGCATDASGYDPDLPDHAGDFEPADELSPDGDRPDEDSDEDVDPPVSDGDVDEEPSDDVDTDDETDDDTSDDEESEEGHCGQGHCEHGQGHGYGHDGHDCDCECPDDEPTCELPEDGETLSHPWASLSPLPTSSLTDGQVTHGRIIVTADTDGDIAIRQLTFHVRHSNVSIDLSSNLRVVGEGTFLPRTETTRCFGDVCDEYEVTITLDEDLWVAAGMSMGLELVTTVSGIESGDWIETSLVSDGDLSSACELGFHDGRLSVDGMVPNIIWLDEKGAYHSGYGITPFGPMTLVAP